MHRREPSTSDIQEPPQPFKDTSKSSAPVATERDPSYGWNQRAQGHTSQWSLTEAEVVSCDSQIDGNTDWYEQFYADYHHDDQSQKQSAPSSGITPHQAYKPRASNESPINPLDLRKMRVPPSTDFNKGRTQSSRLSQQPWSREASSSSQHTPESVSTRDSTQRFSSPVRSKSPLPSRSLSQFRQSPSYPVLASPRHLKASRNRRSWVGVPIIRSESPFAKASSLITTQIVRNYNRSTLEISLTGTRAIFRQQGI